MHCYSGKTAVLHRLQFNEFVNTVPSGGFNTGKAKKAPSNAEPVSFQLLGYGEEIKSNEPLCKSCSRGIDGVASVGDSVDDKRAEVKTGRHRMPKISENQGVPVLTVAHKNERRILL